MASSPVPNEHDFVRIEEQLFTRIGERYRRQVVRHRLIGAGVLVLIAGAGVAGGTVASAKQQRDSASCYRGDSLSSNSVQADGAGNIDDGAKVGTRPTPAKIEHVVLLCESDWEGGVLGKPTPTPPKLQACLQNNLVIAVFPKRDESLRADTFCNNLGLTAP
jgi:hypothetical protein